VTATPLPSPSIPLSSYSWYQASRELGPGGHEKYVLYSGNLGGEAYAPVSLGASEIADRDFGWAFPRVDGIFNGRVILWARENGAQIEVLELETGSIEEVTTEVAGRVYSATADAQLRRVFVVAADPITDVATGVWFDEVADSEPPAKLPIDLGEIPLSASNAVRLEASPTGDVIAVQASTGDVTIVDVVTGRLTVVQPGGAIIALSDAGLVAFGGRTSIGKPDVILYAIPSGRRTVLVEDVDSAQVIAGAEDPLLAYMRIDDLEPRRYVVAVVSLTTGEERKVYEHTDLAAPGPLLARLDQAHIGFEAPTDHTMLVDTFVPFIEAPWAVDKDPEESLYPLLVDVIDSTTRQLGPFVAVAASD